MSSLQKIKIRILLVGIVVIVFVLISTLYSTQIIRGKDYATRADRQYEKPKTTFFDRGNIYFQSKTGTKIAAATVERGYTVYINPKIMDDPVSIYDAVSQFINIDKETFMKISAKKDDPYEEIARKVGSPIADAINTLSIPSVGVIPESWRSYPGGVLASHALGLVGQSTSSTVVSGKYGLERYYEDILARSGASDGTDLFIGLFSGFKDAVLGDEGNSGDIITSIEPSVESYLEKILVSANSVWHPDEIGGIILDPNSGEIIALASLPTFNPNDTSDVKNSSVFSNPLIEHVYEMGSIMKPLTLAMGLDSGAITPEYIYEDTGCLTLDTKKICNFDQRARGKTNIQTILNQSLNVGAANVALRVGSTTVMGYFDKYGIAQRTGIDLPNEANGLLGNLKSGRDIEIATAAYGQGIAMSPISMVRSLSVLANDGYLVQPRLVKEINYSDGSTKKMSRSLVPYRTLKKETVEEVTKMLVNLVDTALKGGSIKMEDYSVAAKTGTAQIPDPKNGGYYSDRYLHSFFGYFPAYNPKFLIFLYQVHPKGAQYASETLTEPFANLTKFLINYYDVPPDRPKR